MGEMTPNADWAAEELRPDRKMAMGGGYFASKVLLSAVGMGLHTELGDKAMTAEEIAARLGFVVRPARDFLDTLVSIDLLARDGDGANSGIETRPKRGTSSIRRARRIGRPAHDLGKPRLPVLGRSHRGVENG